MSSRRNVDIAKTALDARGRVAHDLRGRSGYSFREGTGNEGRQLVRVDAAGYSADLGCKRHGKRWNRGFWAGWRLSDGNHFSSEWCRKAKKNTVTTPTYCCPTAVAADCLAQYQV